MSRDALIDAVRRFSRSYTGRIGVLEESFLGRERPLPVARLLWEIGPEGAVVADLRRRLGLDSGYLSRLLRRLESEDLVGLAPDPADRRRRRATLTSAGLLEWEELDRRSDERAASLVAGLSSQEADDLAEALDRATRLLRAGAITIELADPAGADARRAMSAYFEELDRRFPTGFEVGDALDDAALRLRPPDGACLLAREGIDVVACGGLQRIDASTAEIKRMWVAEAARGLGLGRRLLGALEGEAVRLGHRRVVRDTNPVLLEAIALYESAGYQPTERYNDNPWAGRWFTKDLGAG